MNGVLILAHGSRARKTEETLENVVQMVRGKLPEHIIEIAYMEFGDVNISKGLDNLASQGITNIKVVPYFLFEGIHIKEDIPNEIGEYLKEHEGITITMGQTLGADPRLADILADRVLG